MKDRKRIILAITGASGAIYGFRALEMLSSLDYEVHLLLSQVGTQVIAQELALSTDDLLAKADYFYQPDDLSAPIASGSFNTCGMLVIPCSIKTLSGIATSYADNLVERAADVCLKEGRPLLLAVRETPLHRGHLQLMTLAAQSGAIIFPPVPSFYHKPDSIDSMVTTTVARMLARVGIENDFYQSWGE